MRPTTRRGALSLPEIVGAVVIVGLLAGLAGGAAVRTGDRSQQQAAVQAAGELAAAQQHHRRLYGTYTDRADLLGIDQARLDSDLAVESGRFGVAVAVGSACALHTGTPDAEAAQDGDPDVCTGDAALELALPGDEA